MRMALKKKAIAPPPRRESPGELIGAIVDEALPARPERVRMMIAKAAAIMRVPPVRKLAKNYRAVMPRPITQDHTAGCVCEICYPARMRVLGHSVPPLEGRAHIQAEWRPPAERQPGEDDE